MGKDQPPAHSVAPVADRAAVRWRRVDGVLRLLTVAAFLALASAAVWQFQLIREQLERIEERRIEHLYWTLSRPGTTPEQRTEAFQRLVAAGHTDWKAAKLSNLELEKSILNGVSLRIAFFDACNLRQARMRGVDVSAGGFEACDLTGADLAGAELKECRFFRCTLRKTNFNNVNLSRGGVEQCRLTDVNLSLAKMPEAFLIQAVITDCNLSGADLTAADLTDARFVRTNLRLTQLTGARMQNTQFRDCNWWRARGLSILAIQTFKLRFPPSKTAPEEFRQDYELWLKTAGR